MAVRGSGVTRRSGDRRWKDKKGALLCRASGEGGGAELGNSSCRPPRGGRECGFPLRVLVRNVGGDGGQGQGRLPPESQGLAGGEQVSVVWLWKCLRGR